MAIVAFIHQLLSRSVTLMFLTDLGHRHGETRRGRTTPSVVAFVVVVFYSFNEVSCPGKERREETETGNDSFSEKSLVSNEGSGISFLSDEPREAVFEILFLV